MSDRRELALSDKERIRRRIDVIELAAQIAEGRQIAVRSATGDVIDYIQPEMADRMKALTELLSRSAPRLANVDLTSGGEAGVVFNVRMPDGFGLPNSKPRELAAASPLILDLEAIEEEVFID